ncbi:MAG: branched-chain amino acid ABC transporter substrate-binding protein [Chloroflexi bacterium]|nr:branched-chain amino acid ABC transporter substrate-binding protein [Chloroflexota bacterium]
MVRNTFRNFLVVLAVLALLVVPTLAQDEGTIVVEAGDPVVIGVAAVISGEGLAPLGEDIVRGVELALDERGTVTIGDVEFEVTIDVQDDLCSAEGGQAIANYYVSNPQIVGIVGPTCSSACRAAGPVLDSAGYIMISASCTNPALAADFVSFNRVTPNDDAQGVEDAIFIFDYLGVTKLATIHDGSPYGEGLVANVAAAFEELGGEVVAQDAVTVGDTDFRSTLDGIASAEPELIFFGGFPAEAARLSEQRADAGLADVPFMGADGIFTPELINLGGAAVEGVYISTPAPAASEALDAFVAEYEEKYGFPPTAAFHSYSRDAVLMYLDGIEAVGEIDADGNLVIDRAALADFIANYGAEEPVVGLSGILSCNGDGECSQGGIGFFQVQDGEIVRLETMSMEME